MAQQLKGAIKGERVFLRTMEYCDSASRHTVEAAGKCNHVVVVVSSETPKGDTRLDLYAIPKMEATDDAD